MEMAYKNVHKTIQRIKALYLIEEVQTDKDEHGAKYYRLTEYGIYQLFLKRVQGLYIDQLYFRTFSYVQEIAAHKGIFKYHSDNALFKTFLYPYLNKETLLNLDKILILEILYYLRDCCSIIDKILHMKEAGLPVHKHIYFWNKDSDIDKKNLLSSLKEIFGLEDIDISNTAIKK